MRNTYMYIILCIFCFSCVEKQQMTDVLPVVDTMPVYLSEALPDNEKRIGQMQYMPDDLFCDLDGDAALDSIGLRLDTLLSKYGLVIRYATGKRDTLGMGKTFLDRGFDDFNWVGIMEVAPKGTFYWNYVNYDAPDISEDQIKEEDKITLKQNGIFLHADEACGGGVIYLTDNGKYAWMQQE